VREKVKKETKRTQPIIQPTPKLRDTILSRRLGEDRIEVGLRELLNDALLEEFNGCAISDVRVSPDASTAGEESEHLSEAVDDESTRVALAGEGAVAGKDRPLHRSLRFLVVGVVPDERGDIVGTPYGQASRDAAFKHHHARVTIPVERSRMAHLLDRDSTLGAQKAVIRVLKAFGVGVHHAAGVHHEGEGSRLNQGPEVDDITLKIVRVEFGGVHFDDGEVLRIASDADTKADRRGEDDMS
jgi:hypothetical protein